MCLHHMKEILRNLHYIIEGVFLCETPPPPHTIRTAGLPTVETKVSHLGPESINYPPQSSIRQTAADKDLASERVGLPNLLLSRLRV